MSDSNKVEKEYDDMVSKYGHECPYLNEKHHVDGCPAFKEGCPFKNHACPFKDMSHEKSMEIISKCPHLKEHLSKCPKYNPNRKGCPFEFADGEGHHFDISKCPHFQHHGEGYIPKTHPSTEGAQATDCPYMRMAFTKEDEEKKEEALTLPPGHPTPPAGGDAAQCPFMKMKNASK
eukprot:Awhi_evm1s6672